MAPSFGDPPFACPPDWVFDIPLPPSVLCASRKIVMTAATKENPKRDYALGV